MKCEDAQPRLYAGRLGDVTIKSGPDDVTGPADERGRTIIELIIRCRYHIVRTQRKLLVLTAYTEHFLVNYRPTLMGWCWVDLLVVIGLLCDVHVKYLLGVL